MESNRRSPRTTTGARASAGGARASGGVGNQARVAAWLAALIVAEQPAPWLSGNDQLVALGGETGLAVDDVGGLTDQDGLLAIQAKGRLHLATQETSALRAAVDQVVRQFIDGVPTEDGGNRGVDAQRDRLVIAGDGRSSQAIKELEVVTERLRTLPSAMQLSTVATNTDQRRALDMLLSLTRTSWTAATSSPPSDEHLRDLLRVLVVAVLDLDDGGVERTNAESHLREVLLDPQHDVIAWRALVSLGHSLTERRAWRRRSDVAVELDAVGASVGPGRRHRADVATLRRISEANLKALAEHARLPLSLSVSCQRPAVDDLAAVEGSFVIVGDPGCGKSGVLHELSARLAPVEDTLVLTVEGLPDSAGAARVEFGIHAEVLETLRGWTGSGRANLILDGLDAARGEGTTWLARLCGELNGSRWRVIATIRRFDLRHNPGWQRIFRSPVELPLAGNVAPELAGIRHYLLEAFSDEELRQLAAASPEVSGLLDGVSERMLELVRNPFNLRLAVELLDAGATVASLADIREHLHLLQRYWRMRVVDAADGSSRVRVLSAVTKEMLSRRRLRVDIAVVPDAVLSAADSLLHDGVLHEAASPLLAHGAVLVFSHHILFDFAAAALVLTAEGESRLARLLDEDPDLAVIARPSIDLHLVDLWHAAPDRMTFAGLARDVVSGDHAVAGIGAARVAAENVVEPDDVRWLIEDLRQRPEFAATFINWLCGVLDAADAELVSQVRAALPAWSELSERLADALERGFLPSVAQAQFRLLLQLEKVDPLNPVAGGSAARASSAARLFAVCLLDPAERAWLAVRAAQLLPAAIAVDGGHAAPLLHLTAAEDTLRALGPEVLRQLVEGIGLIADGDLNAAEAVLSAVWRWHEDSEEVTHMSQGVLTLTSTRRQDVDHVKWLSGERFEAFLAKAGLGRAVRVLASVLESDAEQYEGFAREEIHAFGVTGELLPVAHGLEFGPGHGAAEKAVDSFLAHLRTHQAEQAEAAEIVKVIVSSIAHPEFWRRLLLVAAESPAWRIPVARALSSGALLLNSDTRSAAGTLMKATTTLVDGPDHADLLEAPIKRAAELFRPEAAEWQERALDQLVGCLDLARIQDPELHARLERLLMEGEPPAIPDPGTVESFWEPLDLRDVVGADVHDTLSEAATTELNSLRTALGAVESAADADAIAALVDALQRVMELDGLTAEPIQELITRAAERIGREPYVLPDTPVGELVVGILMAAAERPPS